MGRQILSTRHNGNSRSNFWRSLVYALLLPAAFLSSESLAATDVVEQRYSLYCSVCHGDHGDGRSHAQQGLVPPPKDFTSPQFAQSITRERLISSISNGVPGTAMVAWRGEFDEKEVAELADLILHKFAHGPAPTDQSGQNENERIYQETCSVCHGDDGKGAVWGRTSLSVKPRDFTSDQSSNDLSRERMVVSVTHGRPGTPMPGFSSQLTEKQINGVVDYVRARFIGSSDQAVTRNASEEFANDDADYHSLPLPEDLIGNFERGRSLYFQNCIECHGAAGDGDGPRAYFIFPKPRNFLDTATQQILNRPRLYSGIADGVAGREMPAWSKVFSDQQIADVTEFVYDEFISATPASD